MKFELYLVLQGKESEYGPTPKPMVLGNVKLTKGKPSVNADEIAIKLTGTVPDALFRKPTLSASISVPDIAEPVVDADMQQEIAELLKDQMGINLVISAPEVGGE